MGNYYEEHDWKKRWDDIEPYFIGGPYDEVLDIGCAEGKIGRHVSEKVKFVIGIDTRQDAVDLANKEYSYKFTAFCKDIKEYVNETWRYDIILFLGVLHKEPLRFVGIKEKLLDELFIRTKQQLIIRTLTEYSNDIIRTARTNAFDVLIPARSNKGTLFICNRIGG